MTKAKIFLGSMPSSSGTRRNGLLPAVVACLESAAREQDLVGSVCCACARVWQLSVKGKNALEVDDVRHEKGAQKAQSFGPLAVHWVFVGVSGG